MNVIRSTVSTLRDRLAPLSHTSTFRSTGQITPEEFLLAGDYLVYKFPTWSWSEASPASRAVSYLPPDKQFLITRGVPCHRRLDENFAGDAGVADAMVRDGFESEEGKQGREAGGEDDGWLRTGGMAESQEARARDVRIVDEAGNMGERMEEEEDIPDMEDEEDDEEAIIRDPKSRGMNAPLRTYTLHITYTPYYRTPRLYLSGYLSPSEPLPPAAMMEDIVGDYADKTVTLEDFPFYSAGLKMASVHPCKHASVMKTLLDRADAALKLRLQKVRRGEVKGNEALDGGMEGLVDDLNAAKISEGAKAHGNSGGGEEWEVLQSSPGVHSPDEEEVAIRVDQYLVVFLKFMASVTPGIEHDFTMGV